MKTLVLSMISIAATIAAMTACTSESDPINEIDAEVNVPINFGQSINLFTKAIATGDKLYKYNYWYLGDRVLRCS